MEYWAVICQDNVIRYDNEDVAIQDAIWMQQDGHGDVFIGAVKVA